MSKLRKETKAYKNKLKYIKEYNKKYKKVILSFDPIKDKELLDDMLAFGSQPGFVRMLYQEYKKRS